MRTRIASMAAVATLVLASCGGEANDEQAAPSPTATETTPEVAEATADDTEAPAVAAPTEDEETEEPPATEEEAEETEDASPAESAQDTVDSETSKRGNIVKQLGEVASIAPDGGRGEPLVEFKITDIAVDGECTSEYVDEPKNGHYLILTIEATTSPELANEEYLTSWSFSEYDFQVIDNEDNRENDSVGNAYICLDTGDTLPYDIGAGQSVQGKLALDSAYTSGVIAYRPALLGGSGWEWEFGND